MKNIHWGIIGYGDVSEVKSGPGFQNAKNSILTAVMRRLIVLFFIPCFLQAQDYPIHFGLMGGVNISYMEGSEMGALENEYKNPPVPKHFANVGLRISYDLKQWLGLESGAFFSGNGFNLLVNTESIVNWSKNAPQTVTTKQYYQRKITFLEFPLSLRLQTPYFSKTTFLLYGFSGVRFGIVIRAIEKFINETNTSTGIQEKNDEDELQEIDLFQGKTINDSTGRQIHYSYNDFYRRNDFSLCFGVGFEKRFTSVGIFIQGQYQRGILNFYKLSNKARSNILYLDEPSAFFRSLQFSTGLNIFIDRSGKRKTKSKSQDGKSDEIDYDSTPPYL